MTGRELACQGKGWYPARYARVVSSVPLLLAHTRVAAEEVIVHDKHAGGLPQASLLQHDLPHGEARRAACGVRRAACGVRRAAAAWMHVARIVRLRRARFGCEARGARRAIRTSDFMAWHFEVERKSAVLPSPQWPVGVPYDAKETCAEHWDIGTLRQDCTRTSARGMVVRGQRGWATVAAAEAAARRRRRVRPGCGGGGARLGDELSAAVEDDLVVLLGLRTGVRPGGGPGAGVRWREGRRRRLPRGRGDHQEPPQQHTRAHVDLRAARAAPRFWQALAICFVCALCLSLPQAWSLPSRSYVPGSEGEEDLRNEANFATGSLAAAVARTEPAPCKARSRALLRSPRPASSQ